jgi:exopolyphosphatase/guanosine-5'-triphosphate,3'-diphosphate pyrophosphatase
VDVGMSLLRIADGLDRSHSQIVTGVRSRIAGKNVTAKISTRGDAELEIWGARRKREAFEQTFSQRIRIVS